MKFFNISIKVVLAAYLIRILGDKSYGLITWLDSVIQYFIMIVNFGFNIYAAKYIVEYKKKKNKINEIVSSIILIKILLFLFSIISIVLLSVFYNFNGSNHLLILLMFSGLGEVFFPLWFFQGMENLKPATIIVFLSRLFLLIGTLIFVNGATDLFEYILMIVISSIIMGGLGYFHMIKSYKVQIHKVKLSTLISYFKEAIPFFLGRFLSLAFNFGTIFFIGEFCKLEDVAGFDSGLKIVMLGIIPFEMLQQAVFPTISRTKNKNLLKKLVLLAVSIGVIMGLGLFAFSEKIMFLYGGEEMLEYVYVLDLLAILCPFVALTFILGTCSLVAFGYFKEYNFSLISSSIAYIVILAFLYFLDYITFLNLIYLRIFGDVLMLFIRLYFSLSKKILVFN